VVFKSDAGVTEFKRKLGSGAVSQQLMRPAVRPDSVTSLLECPNLRPIHIASALPSPPDSDEEVSCQAMVSQNRRGEFRIRGVPVIKGQLGP
jgi:hypothetical protein